MPDPLNDLVIVRPAVAIPVGRHHRDRVHAWHHLGIRRESRRIQHPRRAALHAHIRRLARRSAEPQPTAARNPRDLVQLIVSRRACGIAALRREPIPRQVIRKDLPPHSTPFPNRA